MGSIIMDQVLALVNKWFMFFICLACDGLCNGCTGAGNTNCSACDVSAKSIDGVANKCVSQCSDHASNFYADSSVCRQCNSACATCNGGNAY